MVGLIPWKYWNNCVRAHVPATGQHLRKFNPWIISLIHCNGTSANIFDYVNFPSYGVTNAVCTHAGCALLPWSSTFGLKYVACKHPSLLIFYDSVYWNLSSNGTNTCTCTGTTASCSLETQGDVCLAGPCLITLVTYLLLSTVSRSHKINDCLCTHTPTHTQHTHTQALTYTHTHTHYTFTNTYTIPTLLIHTNHTHTHR